MDTVHHSAETRRIAAQPPAWPPLAQETAPVIQTPQAAFYLHRSVQCLRVWSMKDSGPIRPLRVNKRLLWRTDDIRQLLGVEVA